MTKRRKSKIMANDANPSEKQPYKSIVEGRAVLRLTSDKVFYNPVQEFNRDLSIAVLSVFTEDYKNNYLTQPKRKGNRKNRKSDEDSIATDDTDETTGNVDITILDALSATGLRSIRYAKEVVDATKIIANDISEEAVETIKKNVNFNNVDHIVDINLEDACILMYNHKDRPKRFTAIDLDPYGCPSIFLDTAVQSVVDGGLLLVTATDMAVMAGNTAEACFNKYRSISFRTKCCHEMGLRILLQCIDAHANKHGRYIKPLLSISADFYIRVFVKVFSGPQECKRTLSKLSLVFRCVSCETITLQQMGEFKCNPKSKNPNVPKPCLPTLKPIGANCEHCDQKFQMGGPIWSEPIHDVDFVKRVLKLVQAAPSQFGTSRRLEGMLSVVSEELPDVPLYYTLDRLCSAVQMEMMPILLLRSAIMNSGYRVSFSHANKLSVKTDAPSKLVWDIMRTWAARRVDPPSKLESKPGLKHLLSREITYTVDLTPHENANPASRRYKQTRFQFNPAPHWGPGCKSAINDGEYKIMKSLINQSKSKRLKNQKRRLSPQEHGYTERKRTNKYKLIIDTATSDQESEPGTDSIERNVKDAGVAAANQDANTDIGESDCNASAAATEKTVLTVSTD